jgi:putative serine protease PepD
VTDEQDRPEPDPVDEPEATEDTAQLWSQPESNQPPVYPSYPQYPGYSQYPYGYQQQYPYAGYPAYSQPQPQAPQPPEGDGQPKARVPGWLWPVVAATALIVGTIGGAIGGTIATDGNSGFSDSGTNGQIGNAPTSLPPLSEDNSSIAAVAAKLLPSTVQVNANGGAGGGTGATGSGFVVDAKGHVITNNHVVADATGSGELEVVDYSGKSHAARIIGRSPVYDIAVLQVENSGSLKPVAIGSSRAMRIGETVVAFGSPLGLSSTVTSGIVSALDRPVTTGSSTAGDSSYINAVQTDAAINPGNSGGPLVNLRGEVVGVNSAIATTGGTVTGESGNIGVGFAIPMEQVRITANQILATGEAKYPVIGANVNTVPNKKGANIVKVNTNTPAEKAGLKANDLVVAVNGKQVTDSIGLIVAIRSHQPGETITLTLLRSGSRKDLQVKLGGEADKP